VLCYGNTTGAINATGAGGTAGYTYSLTTPSSSLAVNTTGIFIGLNPGASSAEYTVMVTDTRNCPAATQMVSLTQPTSAVTSTISGISNVLCFGASTGSAVINASGGTGNITHSWVLSGITSSLAITLSANDYSVISTDANGCNSTQTLIITQPTSSISIATITQTNVSCNTFSAASAELTATGGTGAYTYAWLPSTITSTTNAASSLSAGNYTAIVTDDNNCSTTQVFIITEPATLLATIINTTQAGCNLSDGSATYTTTGGTSGYTYTWITPTNSYTTQANSTNSLSAGLNQLSVVDAQGCMYTASVTITNPNTPLISATTTSVNCYGESTGAITTTVIAGSACTYTWSNGSLSPNISNLPSGMYVLTVKDASNCITVQAIGIVEPNNGITLGVALVTNISCFGTNSGSASVNATGGSPAYTYTWLPTGGNDAMATNLSAQAYTVLATDNGGCTTHTVINITNLTSSPLQVVTESNKGIICEQKNGTIIARVTGGTPAYNYQWNTGTSNNETLSGISEGTYSLVVTDAYGCKDTLEVILACKYELIIPQLITPNGDGRNDKLQIKAIADYPNSKLEIFNRWGSLVYVKLNYNNEWDGKSNVSINGGSDLLPAGTYYVVIDFGDGGATKPYHGYIQLAY
jgi:gliding motility-associated-like protein